MNKPFTVLRDFKHGLAHKLLCIETDPHTNESVKLYGEYSEAEVDVFRHFVQKDSVVIDAGALFGCHTLALSELCPEGIVFAFEPQRIPFQILCANLAFNSVLNVDAVQAALQDSNGMSMMKQLDPKFPVAWGMNQTGAREGVPVAALKLDGYSFTKLDFIKLDVEGDEPRAILGARESLTRLHPVLYVEFNWNENAIVTLLRAADYQLFLHHAPANREPNYLKRAVLNQDQGVPMLLALPESKAKESEWCLQNGFTKV